MKACKDCGICCHWIVIRIPDSKEQRDLWVTRGAFPYIGLDGSSKVGIYYPCPLQKGKLCSKYHVRPKACKEFVPGCLACKEAIQLEKEFERVGRGD